MCRKRHQLSMLSYALETCMTEQMDSAQINTPAKKLSPRAVLFIVTVILTVSLNNLEVLNPQVHIQYAYILNMGQVN